jgi:MFS family permease
MSILTQTVSSTTDPTATLVSHRSPLKKLHSPWLMWAVTVFFVFFQFFLQLSAGIMVSQLMKSFQLTALGAGALAGGFYIVYVLLQTPAGMLVDRIGPRRLLGGGGLVCALGCLMFGLSHDLALAFLGRLLMGAGASFAFVSSLYLVAQWFPEQRFAMMVGLSETMGMLGVLLGNVYLANVLQHTPWRDAMWISALIALILGVGCYLIVRDKPDNDELPVVTPDTTKEFYKDVLWVVRHPRLWLNGLYSGLLFSVVTVFAALWGLPYLTLSQNISLPKATFETALVFIGIGIGGPIMGWVYPRLIDKNLFLSLTALSTAFLTSWLIYETPINLWLGSSLFLLLGIVCSSYVFNYSIANQVVPKHIRSTSIGFTNMLCVVTAPLLQPAVGWILHLVSKNQMHTGQEVYSIGNYHWALSVIPIGLLIAVAIAHFLPKPIR